MRRFLNFLFALVLVLGTGWAELRVESRPEPCSCCETAVPGEPCGCGMPQPSSSQRCGGQQTPASSTLARPAAAPVEVRRTGLHAPREAHPCPGPLAAATRSDRQAVTPRSRTFRPDEGPPDDTSERLAQLSMFRI